MFEFPISKKQLEALTENDLDSLVFLDKSGLLIGCSETFAEYKKRLTNIYEKILELNKTLDDKNKFNIFKNLVLSKEKVIPVCYFEEAAELTENYSFSIKWAPGFFAEKSIGFFTGGFTLVSDSKFPIFILKACFLNRVKWLWYNRKELLAHELCHIARTPLNDNVFEEFFAYKFSFSKLRRTVGGCFNSPLDSVILLIPFLLLMTMEITKVIFIQEIPMLYFWLLCFVYPAFLLLKNHFNKKKYSKAKQSLEEFGIAHKSCDSVLFRSTAEEFKEMADLNVSSQKEAEDYFSRKSSRSLRWKIITERFIQVIRKPNIPINLDPE